MHKIIETTEYYPLAKFFSECGLEIDVKENAPEGTLKMWRCEDVKSGELLAASVLQMRSGVFVLADLAVSESKRKTGLGKLLLDMAEAEAKKLGAEELWGCAKVPAYYKQYDWKEMDRGSSPDISRCQSCDEFGKTCFPAIIKKVL